jgi:phage terminase small subunit
MMPDTTEMQQAFAVAYVANGGNASEAAKTAGYSAVSARQQGSALLDKPHVVAAIHAEQARLIGTELATLAVGVVRGILEDANAHPKLRLDAAKTVLDRAGHIAPRSAELDAGLSKPMNEMSVPELEAFVKRAQEAFARVEASPNPSFNPKDGPSVH